MKIYKFLRENGMTLEDLEKEIVKTELTCRNELYLLETDLIEMYEPLYNEYSCYIPGRTQKEYKRANKDKLAEQRKEYYQKNKQKIADQEKGYYQKNKQKKAEQNKQYRGANKQKIAEQRKRLYQANRDEILQKEKEYYQKNKDKKKQYYQKKKQEKEIVGFSTLLYGLVIQTM